MLVRLNSTLRGRMGLRAIPVDIQGQTDVRTVLSSAISRHPQLGALLFDENGDLQDTIVIFLNGRKIIMLQGLDTAVGPEDVLDCFPKTGVQRAFAHEQPPS